MAYLTNNSKNPYGGTPVAIRTDQVNTKTCFDIRFWSPKPKVLNVLLLTVKYGFQIRFSHFRLILRS